MMVERVVSLEGGYVAPWSHCASWRCQLTHHHYIGSNPDVVIRHVQHAKERCVKFISQPKSPSEVSELNLQESSELRLRGSSKRGNRARPYFYSASQPLRLRYRKYQSKRVNDIRLRQPKADASPSRDLSLQQATEERTYLLN